MNSIHPIKRSALLAAVLWTCLLLVSLCWNVLHEKVEMVERVILEARAVTNEDLSFSAWATRHGGVYVPVGPEARPNPYLRTPKRDLTTTSGLELTLINPAYMMRQVFQRYSTQHGLSTRLVSLRPVHPDNQPDDWERQALQRLDAGDAQVAEVHSDDKGDVLRYMRPLLFEAGCDSCHLAQSYRPGDVRGGLSLSMDLAPSQALLSQTIATLALTHGVLWLVGLGTIGFVARRLALQEGDDDRAEALVMINQHLLREAETRQQVLKAQEESATSFRAIMSTTAEGFCTLDMDGHFLAVNDALCTALGFERGALLAKRLMDIEVGPGADPEQWALNAAAIVAAGHRHLESRYRCADGSIKDVELGISYLAQEGGRFYVFLRDITERKRAEQDLQAHRTNLARLMDNTNDLVWSVDSHCRLVIANAACRHRWQSLFDHDIQAGQVALPSQTGAPSDCPWQTWYERALHGESFTTEVCQDLGEGLLWMEFRISAIVAEGTSPGTTSEVVGVSVFGRDISQRKDDEHRIQETNEQLSLSLAEMHRHQRELKTIKHMSDLVQTCQSQEEAYRVVELSLAELFEGCSGMLYIHSVKQGYLEAVAHWGEPSGLPVFGLEDCWAIRQGQLHGVAGENKHERALVCRHLPEPPQGGHACLPLMAQGELLGTLYVELPAAGLADRSDLWLEDLSQLAGEAVTLALSSLNLRLALREQATHDPLTGLFNRRYLKETLPRELARSVRNQAPLCAVMLDIDHFKLFNDRYGHDAGDLVLKRLGALLKENLRRSDIACRYGGEELLLIMPDSGLVDAAHRINDIRSKVAQLELNLGGRDLGEVTFSVGIAQAPVHGDTMERLLKSADQALYEAKTSGRNQVVCFAPSTARID